jgi:hypothetical protein
MRGLVVKAGQDQTDLAMQGVRQAIVDHITSNS